MEGASNRMERAADLAAEALFGESSELYLRLYEDGIIDSSFGGGFETIDGCAMLMCSGDSNEPDAVREAILAQAKKIAGEKYNDYISAVLHQSGIAQNRMVKTLEDLTDPELKKLFLMLETYLRRWEQKKI